MTNSEIESKNSLSVNKCDKILRNVLDGDCSSLQTLFDLAQCFLAGYDLRNLREMLVSNDLGIVSDGLFVLSEVGSIAAKFEAELAALIQHNDERIMRAAREIAIVYTPHLLK